MKFRLTLLTNILLAPLAALYAAAPVAFDEAHRPQFHFTPPAGWLNDPVGMLYHEGEYHLHYLGAPGKPRGLKYR